MQKHTSIRVIAALLSVLMVVAMCSVAASAANVYDESVDNYYSVVSKQDWELSPGVTESEIVVNNAQGSRRQVLHVVEADLNNEYAHVMTSYTGLQPQTAITPDKYAISGMTTHAADIEQNFGYNVVAGMNCCLSWYNTGVYLQPETSWRINEPLGVMVVDGFTAYGESHGFPQCLVINKDERPEGMAKVEMRTINSSADLTGYEDQVVPTGSGYIVQNGVNQYSQSYTGGEDPRSVVGIKDDGTVVFMMNDGRQAPYSAGMNMYELGQMMISLGCSWAVNCDGGGSSTFLSQRPGEDLKVNCSLSEGTQRANTSGIMVYSTAPLDGEFDRAHVSYDNEYVTPGSTIQFTAVGTDMGGGAADIPADAAWSVTDSSLGSIDQNGLFTSNGSTGQVDAQITVPDDSITDKTIVFTNNKGLTDVRIYFFNSTSSADDKTVGAAWPGTAMTEFGTNEYDQPRYRFEIPEGADKFIINGIYADNPNARYQTADMDAGQTGVYLGDENGWPAKTFDISGLRKVVGEATAYVVEPDRIAFSMENITVPFGKSINFDITAYYGAKIVTKKAGDLNYTLSSNEVGTISGDTFTAAASSAVTEATVTARFGNTDVTATANLSLGRGSEVLFDFEDQDLSDFLSTSQHPCRNLNEIYVADAETGKVHDGEHSLAFHVDFSETEDWGGVQRTDILYIGDEDISLEGAVGIGFWIYIPEETVGMYPTIFINNNQLADWNVNTLSGAMVEESGWRYLHVDLTQISNPKIVTAKDKKEHAKRFIQCVLQYGTNKPFDKSINTDVTYYIDNITVDYSSAIDDREEPVFGAVNCVANDIQGTAVAMPRYETPTINAGTVSFNAAVAENTAKSNYTGLNTASAKAYVDGVEVACNYVGGSIYTDNVTLSGGVHTAKFSICDAMGNKNTVVRKININANSDKPTITLVPHDPTIEHALCGSLYYVDVKASDVKNINAVDMVLDLNNVNDWELQGMEIADGFTGTWTMDEIDHTATLHFESTGNVDLAGEYVIASLPIRVWWCETIDTWSTAWTALFTPSDKQVTPEQIWTSKALWPKDIKVDVDYGQITFKDNSTSTFSGDQFVAQTEMYYANVTGATYTGAAEFDAADYATKTRWHKHEAHAVEDLAPTCTEAGYTGRTFCDECNSVVDWGTEVPATGHTYTAQNGKLVCACGDIYAINGLEKVGDTYYYGVNGNLYSGWQMIDNDWYYFDTTTYAPVATLNNGHVTYAFEENGKLVSGQWETTAAGSRYYYGPDYYHYVHDTYVVIDGDTYCFDRSGYRFEGISPVYNRPTEDYFWKDFGNDGKLVGDYDYTGFIDYKGHKYYVINGVTGYGMYEVEGDYYYAASANKRALVANVTRACSVMNGVMKNGTYTFGSDCKMLNNKVAAVDGKLYCFVMGQPAKKSGVVEMNGAEYAYEADGFVSTFTGTYTDACDVTGYYINGVYAAKNGLRFDDDGEIRYYENDVPIYYGLAQSEAGDYYYINSTKKAVKNCTYSIGTTKANGLMPAGRYEFGADGKMILPEPVVVKNGLSFDDDGEIRYYENDVPIYYGLAQSEAGDYYYINSTKKAVKNCTYSIGTTKANGLMPAGRYEFGADGKMILPEPHVAKNGLFFDDDGEIRYYENDVPIYYGLVEHDGDYYYINSSKKAVKNCSYSIGKTRANGLMPAGRYQFGPDGKMILN